MPIQARLHRAQGALTTLTNGRHAWHADVDKTLGSDDLAPDPHDLLDSALAACTVLTLELYIRRRKLAVTDLRVDISHEEGKTEDGQVRYQLQRSLHIEGDITPEDRAKLLEIANKCPIHRVLEGDISVATTLVD
ncbi:OsmC family protein [Rhodoferax sp.]|uniref:OsmC family protein n=1 Tax=Rhodoferax sp. TaxID=50421 RepID=UPI0025E6445C|nr:OsmC family protein [Rhodoferax sp.]